MEREPTTSEDPTGNLPLHIEPEQLPDGRSITFYSRPAADDEASGGPPDAS